MEGGQSGEQWERQEGNNDGNNGRIMGGNGGTIGKHCFGGTMGS